MTVERNIAGSAKTPPGGLILFRDVDPGEPGTVFGGFGSAYYSSRVAEVGLVEALDENSGD